jgi:flavin reductase (DIM6/NTAB) family NADH-FMN oxidoreductase RutF
MNEVYQDGWTAQGAYPRGPETHFYEPSAGHRLAHDPLKAIIAPRPIGWISTMDPDGQVNLAPYSFFNGLNEKPPILMFSGTAHKDSIRNARATGEFVFNMVTKKFADAMNTSCAVVPHEVNEMRMAELQGAASTTVRPPRVAGVAAAVECKVLHIHELKDLGGKDLGQHVVIGQATGIHIDPALIRDGIFDLAAARPLARCGYRGDYVEVTELFEMVRPNEAETTDLLRRYADALVR